MGFWDNDSVSVVSRRSHDGRKKYTVERSKKSKSRSRSRSPSRSRGGHGVSSIFGGGHGKHNSSRASFFSLPGGSRSSFFGLGRSSSYYKRSPRKNFISRAFRKLKHLLRDLTKHARRHPFRVFMLVLVPLITCGALTALLARFGLRLPSYVERLITAAGKLATGDSVGLVGEAVKMVSGKGGSDVGKGSDGEFRFERKKTETSWF